MIRFTVTSYKSEY